MKIIDNINNLLGDDLKQTIKLGSKVKIAASCFSIYAYEALKEQLESIESLQFIFTAPTFVEAQITDKLKKQRREFHIPKFDREKNLYGSEFEIQLKNKLTQRAIARECADWIKRKASFKSNRGDKAMQQFACVKEQNKANTLYTPITGFTAVELGYQQGDAVSNYVNKAEDAPSTEQYLGLFEQIWNDKDQLEDVTDKICDHISSVYQENSPQKVYFFILYNIFNEFLEDLSEDVLPNDRTGYQESLIWKKLYNFQKDAATGIINKLETYNGCILADSVGLGKTFTALAVIKYYELRNRSVLVLCPKKLADNWLTYNRNLTTNIFAKDRFNYDVLCHTDLQRVKGESFGTRLEQVNWGNYDLIVIDESHNFRNNDAYKDKETRYQKLMNKVIKQGVKTKVLMLSATPVNNRFADLRNQLALAYEGDSENINRKLNTHKDVEEIFRKAQAAFNKWSTLPPAERTVSNILNQLEFDFFELLDSVTIARSRRHIQNFYDTKDIGEFPNRLKPLSFHRQLTDRNDAVNYNQIFNMLRSLNLSVYAPVSYILRSRLSEYEAKYDTEVSGGKGKLKQADRERNLQALMTTNLLKRLESSVEAFRLTLQKLKQSHESVLFKIENYLSTGKDPGLVDVAPCLENLEPDEENELLPDDATIGSTVEIKLCDMDLLSWKHDLNADLLIIDNLINEMLKINVQHDAKLQHLIELIEDKIKNPINANNKKIIIFTAYADTANYLYENISLKMLELFNIHTAIVTGSNSPKSTLKKHYDYQGILTLFSPVSKEKSNIYPNDLNKIDVLIATDCISEGQNLQDCDFLINYDIHWNPVRIIQRFGRIDRIGSINKFIQLVNYWPDISLDEYINLKERVENRMVIADVTATGDDNVLSAQSNDVAYRKEQLRRLQDEVIEMEDLKTGVSITDLGLNDFRMDLLNYVRNNNDISGIPTGIHAVIPENLDKGLSSGVIFVLRNRNQGINIQQLNRLHPYYLIYINEDGEILVNHAEVKKQLDLIRGHCKEQELPIAELCSKFNHETNDGQNMAQYSELLRKAVQSIIQFKEEKDIDSLFSPGRTTALTDPITGLNDFELIAFLVIS